MVDKRKTQELEADPKSDTTSQSQMQFAPHHHQMLGLEQVHPTRTRRKSVRRRSAILQAHVQLITIDYDWL